jgi:hypothetical protein
MSKRIEFLLSKNQDLGHETIISLSKLDPTKELKYLNWIVNRYKKDGLSSSDFLAIRHLLLSFDENKNLFPTDKKDINFFKNILQLSIFLFEFEKTKKLDENKFLEQGVIKLYEDSNLLLLKPFTRESAVKFGKTTAWCTSSICPRENRFYSYLNSGELFILIDKTKPDNYNNKKFQFYFSFCGNSTEFRDSSNSTIDAIKLFRKNKNIFNVLLKYESVRNVVSKNAEFFYFLENPTKKQIVNAIKIKPEIFCDLKEADEEMQILYFKSFKEGESSKIILEAFKNIMKITNPCYEVRKMAIEKYSEISIFIQQELGKLTNKEQISALKQNSKLIYDIENPCNEAIDEVLKFEPEYIFKISNPTNEQLLMASTNKDGLLNKYINQNKLDPKKLVDVILEVSSYDLKAFKKYYKLLNESQLIDLIEECPDYIRYVKNPSEKIQQIAVSCDYSVFQFIENPSDSIKALYECKQKENETFLNSRNEFKKIDYYTYYQMNGDGYNNDGYYYDFYDKFTKDLLESDMKDIIKKYLDNKKIKY